MDNTPIEDKKEIIAKIIHETVQYHTMYNTFTNVNEASEKIYNLFEPKEQVTNEEDTTFDLNAFQEFASNTKNILAELKKIPQEDKLTVERINKMRGIEPMQEGNEFDKWSENNKQFIRDMVSKPLSGEEKEGNDIANEDKYPVCPNCNSKLYYYQDMLRCSKCGKYYDIPDRPKLSDIANGRDEVPEQDSWVLINIGHPVPIVCCYKGNGKYLAHNLNEIWEQEDVEDWIYCKDIFKSQSLPIEEENGWDWAVIFHGALTELVELKEIKDKEGKTDDYLERQPKAWHLAKQSIELWAKSDYGATPAPIEEGKDAIELVYPKCSICGGKQVSIRGRFPKQESRFTCPGCTYERLEQINEISSKNYGQAGKA